MASKSGAPALEPDEREKKNSTCRARGVAARVEAGGYVDGVDEAGSAGGVGIGPA